MKKSFLFILCITFISNHCFAPHDFDESKYPTEIIQLKNEFVAKTLRQTDETLLEMAAQPEGMGGNLSKNFPDLNFYIFQNLDPAKEPLSEEEKRKREALFQQITNELKPIRKRIIPTRIKGHCKKKLSPKMQRFVENYESKIKENNLDTISLTESRYPIPFYKITSENPNEQLFLQANLTKDQYGPLYVLLRFIHSETVLHHQH